MPHSSQEESNRAFCKVLESRFINGLEEATETEIMAGLKFFLQLFKVNM